MDEPLSISELKSVIVQKIRDEFSDTISFRTACLIADIAITESYKNVDKMCVKTIKSKLENLI